MKFRRLIKGGFRLTGVVLGRTTAYLGVLLLAFAAGVIARPVVEEHTPSDIQSQLGLEFAKEAKPEPRVVKFSGEHAKKNLITLACFADRIDTLSFPDDFEKMLRNNLEWVIMIDVDAEPDRSTGEMSYLIADNIDGLDKPSQKTVTTPTLSIVTILLPMSGNRILQARLTIRASKFHVKMLPVEQVRELKEEKPEEPESKTKPEDDDF